jgi:GT2 family glycosyltransferase
MEQNHPLVSINLLTHNAQTYLESCLASVFKQSYPRLEILIIDNQSADGTINYLKSLKARPDLRVIFNQKNLGFAAGHNQGIRESRGDFVCCLNQDVVLDRDFIQRAVQELLRDNKTGALQGKLLRWNIGNLSLGRPTDYQISYIIDTTGLVFLKNRRIVNRGQGEIEQGQFGKKEEIFGADGAAPVYRRQALEDVKISVPSQAEGYDEYFDEDFFCYKEDVDLAWRLRLAGWKSIYQPVCLAWHARTSGESAASNYFSIIRERLKINKFSKYLAFKNQRLMQVKNEQVGLLLKHLPWFLPKEIASWFYVLLLEKYTWRAIRDLFRQMPAAWQKRKIIMANKKSKAGQMEKWFK